MPVEQESATFEIEFRWKEVVIYWEGSRGCAFQGGWGVQPLVTYVPDAASWDLQVPDWLRGRREEVVSRLRTDPRHVVEDKPDDLAVDPYPEVLR